MLHHPGNSTRIDYISGLLGADIAFEITHRRMVFKC